MSAPLSREIAREAWRNLLTDTSHAGVWVLIVTTVLSLLGWADTFQVASLVNQSTAYIVGGGATWILQAPGQIDGASCDGLQMASGVHGAGALRDTQSSLTAVALPGAPLPMYEVTTGFPQVLGVSANDGILVPDHVATRLSASPDTQLVTNSGMVKVGAVYNYPDDGRRSVFAYAALALVPASGIFDECWITVWPTSQTTISLLYIALSSQSGQYQASPQLSQLNPTYSDQMDAAALYQSRFTRFAGWACLLFGLVIGFASLLGRRLELASSIHLGVPRGALCCQMLFEASFWISIAMLISSSLIIWQAISAANDKWPVALLGLRCVVSGGVGCLIGNLVSCVTVRERRLFSLFKSR